MRGVLDKMLEIRDVLAYLTEEGMLFSTKSSNFANESAEKPQNRNIIMRFMVSQ